MRAPVLGVLLLAAIAAGCASSGGGNPNLLAPKLVVQARSDGNVTLFVHGAFREESYDWLSLSIDNQTLVNRTEAFSVEENVRSSGFFAQAEGQTSGQLYEARARIDVEPAGDRILVSFQNGDAWTDAKSYALPYEHVLDRPKVSP
jgi:hypothetical protein